MSLLRLAIHAVMRYLHGQYDKIPAKNTLYFSFLRIRDKSR